MIGWTKRDWELYLYAFPRTLSVLVNYAAERGRGWYQFADGEVITASEVAPVSLFTVLRQAKAECLSSRRGRP